MSDHTPAARLSRPRRTPWPFALLAVFTALVVRNAWLSDDAYITFRTVDNLIGGYGPTWNVAERVQTYTHPLWMGLLAVAYAGTREIYYTCLLLSIGLSVLAVWLVAQRTAASAVRCALGWLVFCCSKAFVDYATSGLENPLTHLILVGFLLLTFRETPARWQLFWMGLLAGLGMVTRLDTVLLYAPVLLYGMVKRRSIGALIEVGLGLTPVLLWELFSLFYYGVPFPNTAYAKLNAGLITQAELIREGLFYLQNSLRVDPVTLVTIGIASVLPVASGDSRKLPIVAGMWLYLAYVVKVGGDFMSGRFLTAPLLAAVAVLVHTEWPPVRFAWGLVGVVLALGLSAPYSPLRSGGAHSADADPRVWVRGRSITDERAAYYTNTGLLLSLRDGVARPNHDWATEGRTDSSAGAQVRVKSSVGFYGYFVGPDTHIVDLLGLGDPLLARLPVTDPNWQIGHFGRRPPRGYLETLQSGRNQIEDPGLAAYYDRLSFIIRGPLWDSQRWLEIWRFNTGRYDALLDAYAYSRGPLFTQNLVIENATGKPLVYAYIWNNGAGEAYLLDDASTLGKTYPLRWEITPAGVAFTGAYVRPVSALGALSDHEPLNMGLYFSDTPDLAAYDIYEYRFWFRVDDDGVMTFILPPLAWHNPEAPQGYWREADITAVMRLVSR